MRKYIVFFALDSEGWESRQLHTGALTDILAEHTDSSDQSIPEIGYRVTEYAKLSEDQMGTSTHSREGDWVVESINVYEPRSESQFSQVVHCYCRYSPIEPVWVEIKEGCEQI